MKKHGDLKHLLGNRYYHTLFGLFSPQGNKKHLKYIVGINPIFKLGSHCGLLQNLLNNFVDNLNKTRKYF